MPDDLIQPISNRFTATITPPGSKSLTNRALVLAALAEGESELSNVLLADDTRVMIDALRATFPCAGSCALPAQVIPTPSRVCAESL